MFTVISICKLYEVTSKNMLNIRIHTNHTTLSFEVVIWVGDKLTTPPLLTSRLVLRHKKMYVVSTD